MSDLEQESVQFLQASPLFRAVPSNILNQLIKQFEDVHISSGEILFEEGEQGDSLFLVIYGRLRALQKKHTYEEHSIAEISSGEIIGEFALLTEETRRATIIAIRDSKLLRLSKEAFDAFVKSNPALIFPVIKSSLQRVLNPPKPAMITTDILAIAPAGDSFTHDKLAHHLAEGLGLIAPTLYLKRQTVLELLKQQGIDEQALNDEHHAKISDWFNGLETTYRYIICETDKDYSAWTKRCLRQASTILLVADFTDKESLNHIEHAIFSQPARQRKKVNLVLLHQTSVQPSGTSRWLTHRTLESHYHICENSQEDMRRLIHIVRGHAIALVLGGGGARALAHIGVYKALTHLKVPIDLVCGTSFGAMVGALIAMNYTAEEITDILRREIVNNKSLFSYTVPILSLYNGKSWTTGFKRFLGNTQIEDLWRRYFCVACNITKNQSENFREGSLATALRASVSLPGIVPPISNAAGELFLDGGVLNNLPVDAMRLFAGTGQIIAVRVSPTVVLKAHIPDGYVSGWRLLLQRYFKKNQHTSLPSMAEIITKSVMLAGEKHEHLMAQKADCFINIDAKEVGLFDFNNIDKLIEIGYSTTLNKLSNLPNMFNI